MNTPRLCSSAVKLLPALKFASRTLREIEAYMIKTANRSLMKRVVLSKKMKDDLGKYRGKLDAASRVFEVRFLYHF